VRRAVLAVLFASLAGGSAADEPAPLLAGAPVERELAPGETHSYLFGLEAGQFASVHVGQEAVDVTLAVTGPDGATVAAVDNGEGGWSGEPEDVSIVAERAGPYRVDVAVSSSTGSRGPYRIELHPPRDASAADRQRVEAERIFSEANALEQKKQFREARPKYTQARALSKAAGDLRGEGAAAEFEGGVASALGSFEDALRLRNEARALYRAAGATKAEANVVLRIANGYQGVGDFERTLDYYEQARALFAAAGATGGEPFLLLSIGSIHHRKLGDQARALEYFQRATIAARAAGDRALETSAYDWTGNVYRTLEDYPHALEEYGRSLELAQAIHSTFQEAMALSRLGSVQARLGDAEQAIALHVRALELARQSDGANRGGTDVVLLVLRSYADACERLGLYEQALEQGQAALARAGQDPDLADKARYYLARVKRDRGDLPGALSEMTAVLASLELRRTQVLRDTARASLQGLTHSYYELAIDLLMRLDALEPGGGHAAAALQVAERMRARTLLDLLGEAGVNLREGVDPGLVERETAARRALDQAARKRDGGAADAELRLRTEEYETVRAEIRRQSPRYATLTETQPLTLSQVQGLLDPDTFLLEYALGDERSHLWVVSPAALDVHELPGRKAIEEAALELRRRLTTRPETGDGMVAEAAARLASLLLSPAGARIASARRLLVVADGALQAVPFGVLPFGGNAAEPLVARREVVSLPSASVLAAIRTEVAGRKPAPREVAVLADPVFEAKDPRVRGAAAAAAEPSLTARTLERAVDDVGLRGGHIPRLPFTRREAAAATGGARPGEALRELDFAASREAAKGGALSEYRIVHFASHGLLNVTHPELSGIVLSLVDERGRSRDGFLRLHDVYGLKLPADLVVLSGCQTGLGREIRGEGLLSLTRGFMYAGAARVVSSLWKVDDRATAELMERFYRVLRSPRRPSPASALREAQAQMAREARWRAPYYWAGFVLQGEWR
jgi:CHAT domain-containing protein/tetratricopeptide (TPR) repeat protein